MTEKENDFGKSARDLAKLGASRGGHARAEKLSREERQEIARHAASKRWGTLALAAPFPGEIVIGNREISCAVLEDSTRVINQETFLKALGRAGKAKGGTGGSVGEIPPFLSAGNLRRYISPELEELAKPIPYVLAGGGRSVGYKAEILPAVCDVYLEARKDDVLLPNQRRAAEAAEILVRGLARIGIIALIDEATGYQEVRARNELERILAAYVQAELRPWVKMFPDEFFRQIYRLQGWEYKPGNSKRTPYVGKLVNKYVYEQLPQGVLDILRQKNPRTERGYRAHKHFQFLTVNTGNPHLDRQISTVTTLMRISNSKFEFEDLFERAFPPAQPRLPLIIDVPTDDKS